MIDTIRLKALREVSYETVNKDTLVNVNEVTIKKVNTFFESIELFLNEVKNPYIMKCGKTVVEIEFIDTGKTIDTQMKSYLKSLKVR